MDFLSEVEKKLDLPPGEKAQVIRELKSHYEELKGELVASGMDADLAAQEASRKLGDPADVSSRLQAIHCRATWKTALLAAIPLAASAALRLSAFPMSRAVLGEHAPKSAIYTYHTYVMIATLVFAMIFLAGSVRELVRNRRPMWLATWFAVGINELVTAVRRLEEFTAWVEGERIPQAGVFPSFALLILLVGLLAMATFRRSTKWFFILGGWTVLAEVIYRAVPWESIAPGWFHAFAALVPAPLVMAVALGLFARHPYGNTAQASLFLFAFYVNITSISGRLNQWFFIVFNVLPALVIIATMLWYARTGNWRWKLAVLAGGIVATSLTNLAIFVSAYQVLHTVFMLFWVILVPLLFERRWSERRPEFVR